MANKSLPYLFPRNDVLQLTAPFPHLSLFSRNKEELSKNIEEASEPFMDRARQVKEQVDTATANLKTNLHAQGEALHDKSGKLRE